MLNLRYEKVKKNLGDTQDHPRKSRKYLVSAATDEQPCCLMYQYVMYNARNAYTCTVYVRFIEDGRRAYVYRTRTIQLSDDIRSRAHFDQALSCTKVDNATLSQSFL